MDLELKIISMKVDALVEAMNTLAHQMDVRHTGVLGTFHSALEEVERMKFQVLMEGAREPNGVSEGSVQNLDTVQIKEVEEFLRQRAKVVLSHQADRGLKIRPDDNHFNRYVIYLGKADVPQSTRNISRTQNPRLTLEFDFDYYRPTHEWQMIENVRLIVTGGEFGYQIPNITARVIPDKLIRRETWTQIVRRALAAIECHEVMDELETYFPKETPHEYA